MEQQPSIFDEQFDLDIPVRRRELLSSVLKVFLWIIMSGAAIMTLGTLMMMVLIMIWPEEIAYGGNEISMLLGFAFLFFIVVMAFSMTFLVWSEVKWAIRFNKVVFALWLVSAGIMVLFSGKPVLQLMAPTGIILLTYWILLFRIQRKWEH